MRCIAVINQKGGVGKTTSTVNIGAAFANAGKKVLLLDVDPQANLTLHLDRRPEEGAGTMTEMLVEDVPLRDIMVPTDTDGLYMVPADTSLSGVETQLANRIGREMILREALETAAEGDPEFDYVFLDCPPSLGVLSANALVAAEHVVIPMQAEYFSMQGMTKLMEVMELVRRSLNPTIDIALILPCMVDRRTNLTNEVLGELRRHFGDVLANGCIRSNVKLAEAPSFGRTIFQHAADSNGARDYQVIADELMARLEGTFEPPSIEEPEEEVAAVELTTDEDETATEPEPAEPDRAELEAAFADVVEEPVAEEPVAEDPIVEEPVTEDPVAEEPVTEDPVAEEPVAEEPVAEERAEIEVESTMPEAIRPEPVIETATEPEPAEPDPAEFEVTEPEPTVAAEPTVEPSAEETPVGDSYIASVSAESPTPVDAAPIPKAATPLDITAPKNGLPSQQPTPPEPTEKPAEKEEGLGQ